MLRQKIAVAEATLANQTIITPSTTRVEHIEYYMLVRKKIEALGTEHFPRFGDTKLYGKLVVSIPILADGTLSMQNGGPVVEKGSGNANLDKAALDIVGQAAPFDAPPSYLVVDPSAHVWVIISVFDFGFDQSAH